jgi:hypothetical protein
MSINIKILDVPGMHSKTLREKTICFCKSESQKRKSEIKVLEQKLKSLNVKEDDLWKQCVKPQT